VQLDEREARLLSHGVRLPVPGHLASGGDPVDPNLAGPKPMAAFGPDGSLIALVGEQDSELQPLAVFLP